MVEVVCHFFISHSEINVVKHTSCKGLSLLVCGEGDGFKFVHEKVASMPEMLEPMGRPSFWRKLDL